MTGDEGVAGGGTPANGTAGVASRRSFLRATGMGTIALGTGLGLSSSAVAATDGSFVGVDGTEFVVDGEPIHFNGSNNFWLMDTYYGTPSLHDTVLSLYDRLGLNFVRTWGFRDGTSEHGPMLQPEPGTYNETAFERFDSLVAKAGEYGVKLVLPLVNNWEEYGGKGQYVEWVDGASGKDAFYTNSECRQLFKDYVEYVLTRENTITGVEYRNDPAIAIWELGNEPRAPTLQNNVGAMGDWVADVSAHIKDLAPDQLVSTGMEGFYADSDHGSGYGYDGSDGTDYVAHHQIDTVDACSYHIYPDAWGKSPEWATDWIAQHQTDAADVIGKPAYCGEFGLSLANHAMAERNSYYRSWYDAFDQYDADGVAVWQVDRGTRAERVGDDEPAHGIYTDDAETLAIVQEYGRTARGKSNVALEPDAPHAPTGVALSGRTASSLDVAWNATVGWGVGADHYEVRVDGESVATVPAGTTSATVTGLDPATGYEVTVVAVDTDGTRSAPSGPASLSTLPGETATFTDACADTSKLDAASDAGMLTTDTTNSNYFTRPDGTTDGSRLNRSSAEEVAMVYSVDGQLLDMSVEYHLNANQGASVAYYASADGGSTWSAIDAVRTVYDGPGSGGWSNQLHTRAGFSSDVDRVKIVLGGTGQAWANQIGNVALTYADGSSTPPAEGPTDPDDDELYEDVNGNGRFESDDVVTLFEDKDTLSNPERFDFNGNERLDFDDVVTLFSEL